MAEAAATEAAATTATRRGMTTRRKVLLGIAAVIALDVAAAFLAPPVSPTGGAYQFPRDAILQNLEQLAPHELFAIAPGFTITSTIFTTWLVMAVVILGVWLATRTLREIPRGAQNVFEFMYEGLSGFAESLGGPAGRRYVPLFLGLFLFIIFSNWSGLMPFVGKVEFLRAPTSDINVTLGLALVSFTTFHVEGVRRLGVRGYLGKFFSLRGFKRSPFDGVIDLFVGVLEFFLEFFKLLTLSLRLFANIYGGELVLGVMTGLLVVVAPVAFLGLEVFVGFMQALVFSILTMMFTLLAIEGHEGGEHESHEATASASHEAHPAAAAA
ncbi:MAG: F-type +-transporting ATPase subunit a [Chloroflexi bacterium]|nr:F-type +-transporting ATPase subunit a [Chloroflexota bacterium]